MGKYFKCCACGKLCDVETIEQYDIEEFWGAPVRRYYYEDRSDCCHDEVEEISQEEADEIEE